MVIISTISTSEAINLMYSIEKHKHVLKLNIRNNFWSCKFTSNSDLNKKVENYKQKL